MPRPTLGFQLLCSLALAACAGSEPETPAPAAEPDPLSHPLLGLGTADIEGYVRDLAENHTFATAACLPLVSHEMDTTTPQVMELGIQMADAVAGLLEKRSPGATVLAPLDVESRMLHTGQPMDLVYREEALPHLADRLGAEMIVSGTIRPRRGPGGAFQAFLEIDLHGLHVPSGQTHSCTVRLDADAPDHVLAWSLSTQDGHWGER